MKWTDIISYLRITHADVRGIAVRSMKSQYEIELALESFQTKHCSSTKYADNKRVSEVLPNEYWSRISVTPFLGCIERHNDVIMDAMASKITILTFVYSTVYPGADQRKHQSRASQAFGRGVPHRANAGQLLAHNVTQGYFYFVTLFTSSRWSDIYASVK